MGNRGLYGLRHFSVKKTYISLVSTRLGYVHNNYLKYIPKYNGALWTAMTTSKNQKFHKTVVYLIVRAILLHMSTWLAQRQARCTPFALH